MTAGFYVRSPDNPVATSAPAKKIAPGRPVTLPRAQPEAVRGWTQLYGSAARNSRAPARLADAWRVRWRSPLGDAVRPSAVLQGRDRIVVQGRHDWQLFDREGKQIADGPHASSPLFLDEAHGLFYLADRYGYVTARRLSDGGEEFVLGAYFGNEFDRILVDRHGAHLLVVSVERAMGAHGARNPNLTVIEVQHLGDPGIQKDENGLVVSARRTAEVMRNGIDIVAALQAGVLIVAVPQRVVLFDRDTLRLRIEMEGDLMPTAMSLDEASRMYLLSASHDRQRLLVLAAEGYALISLDLPRDFPALIAPPIVGYDHRIYLAGKTRILALDAAGVTTWDRAAGGAVTGAVVTADDKLLAGIGDTLVAFAADGTRTLLKTFEGELLRTAPVLTADGELIVASDDYLYCLAST